LDNKLNTLEKIEEIIKPTGNLPDAVNRLISENSTLRKTVEHLEAEAAVIIKAQLMERSEMINGIRVVTGHIKNTSNNMLKSIASKIRETGESVLFAAGAEQNGKANLVVMVSDDLIRDKNLNAGTLIKEAAREINGGGGGQPFLATAGGKNPDGIGAALKKIKDIIRNL
ncbi:MAG: alanine--tRNA ligase, partial [Bacteroidales bacterium]|nr:alanine--tRNA ligase [Bacteroidales bacterium]